MEHPAAFIFIYKYIFSFFWSKNGSDTVPNGYKNVKYTFTTNSNLEYNINYRIPNGQFPMVSARHDWSYTGNFSMDPGIPYGRDLGFAVTLSNSNSSNDLDNDIPQAQLKMDLKIFINGNLVLETTPTKSYYTGIEYYLH